MPDLIEAEDYDGIKDIMTDALNAGKLEDLGHDYYRDVDDRLKLELRRAIPTSLKALNEHLKGGGVGPGEIGFFMAFTGVGKTRNLINVGHEAIMAGYNVVHYTLELSEVVVGNMYDGCAFNIPTNES